MKPTESVPSAAPVAGSRRSPPAARCGEVTEERQTEEQAFFAAQEVAFAALRTYHASRPRRKR
jgi:hypothetical protein